MDADALLKSRRSVRRYRQDPIPLATLREIVEVARYAPSGGNRQPWEVILVHEPEVVREVFLDVAWHPAVGAPPEGKRPVAYVVVISEGKPRVSDCASLVTYMLLAAHARGIGTCWIGSIKTARLAEALQIPDDYSIVFVVSLGYPDERFEAYENAADTSVTLEGGVVRVPKRPVEAILHENTFRR